MPFNWIEKSCYTYSTNARTNNGVFISFHLAYTHSQHFCDGIKQVLRAKRNKKKKTENNNNNNIDNEQNKKKKENKANQTKTCIDVTRLREAEFRQTAV